MCGPGIASSHTRSAVQLSHVLRRTGVFVSSDAMLCEDNSTIGRVLDWADLTNAFKCYVNCSTRVVEIVLHQMWWQPVSLGVRGHSFIALPPRATTVIVPPPCSTSSWKVIRPVTMTSK